MSLQPVTSNRNTVQPQTQYETGINNKNLTQNQIVQVIQNKIFYKKSDGTSLDGRVSYRKPKNNTNEYQVEDLQSRFRLEEKSISNNLVEVEAPKKGSDITVNEEALNVKPQKVQEIIPQPSPRPSSRTVNSRENIHAIKTSVSKNLKKFENTKNFELFNDDEELNVFRITSESPPVDNVSLNDSNNIHIEIETDTSNDNKDIVLIGGGIRVEMEGKKALKLTEKEKTKVRWIKHNWLNLKSKDLIKTLSEAYENSNYDKSPYSETARSAFLKLLAKKKRKASLIKAVENIFLRYTIKKEWICLSNEEIIRRLTENFRASESRLSPLKSNEISLLLELLAEEDREHDFIFAINVPELDKLENAYRDKNVLPVPFLVEYTNRHIPDLLSKHIPESISFINESKKKKENKKENPALTEFCKELIGDIIGHCYMNMSYPYCKTFSKMRAYFEACGGANESDTTFRNLFIYNLFLNPLTLQCDGAKIAEYEKRKEFYDPGFTVIFAKELKKIFTKVLNLDDSLDFRINEFMNFLTKQI